MFALRYFDTEKEAVILTAPQSLNVIRDMADYYENKGFEVISFVICSS